MAQINQARRAEIGREKRARTRAQIVEAGLMLLAERPPEALTIDAIVEAAGVAKGTFYYHFQNIEELVAAVGGKLAESFDALFGTIPARCAGSGRAHVLRLHAIPGEGHQRPAVGSACAPKRRSSGRDRPGSRESQGRPCRGDRPGTTRHTGRGAGGRYCHRHLASGDPRQS